jgi:hypothetical protein
MAGQEGSSFAVEFGGTTLETDFRAASTDEMSELIDDTAGSDSNRHYLAGVKDGTMTLTIVRQSSDSSTWDAVAPGTSGTLVWSGAGDGTNTVDALVESRSNSIDYGDVVTADVTFQFIGAVS